MSDDDEVRTCVTCKHFKGPENHYVAQMTPGPMDRSPQCAHPKAASRDMIYGKAYCTMERQSKKGCGQKGVLWESKDGAKSN